MRDCLTEASDLDGCRELLAGIESGSIEVYGRDTVQPSVFSHQILNAMPYAFLDDAPLEERRRGPCLCAALCRRTPAT